MDSGVIVTRVQNIGLTMTGVMDSEVLMTKEIFIRVRDQGNGQWSNESLAIDLSEGHWSKRLRSNGLEVKE